MSFKPFRFITTIGMRLPLAFLLLFTCSLFTSLVYAEGSRDLIANGGSPQGNRAFLEFSDYTRDNILRKGIIKVFVNAGEWVYLGSSVFNAVPNSTQDIVYRSPAGTQNGSCDVKDVTDATGPAQGFIDTLAKEAAGPKTPTNPNGYIPCKFQATETGIYEIEFHPPKICTPDPIKPTKCTPVYPKATLVTAAFPTNNPLKSPIPDQGMTVSAWDVTVMKTQDDLTTEQKGRAYANFLPMTVVGAAAPWYSTIYVLTNKGILYRIKTNGMMPQHFTTFANNKGFTDATGKPLFQSVPATSSAIFYDPSKPDDATNITHKIFFNPPDVPTVADPVALPLTAPSPSGNIWLLSAQPNPPSVTNFTFTGNEGTSGQAGVNPLGGVFSFDTDTASGSYVLTIDTSGNGVYGDVNDRTFTGTSVLGYNTFSWDGLDGTGSPVLPSPIPYDAKMTLSIDDVHFPFLDVENNPNGLIIQQIDRNNTAVVKNDLVYYSDAGLTIITGNVPPDPISAVQGISSSAGAQKFSGSFGNGKGIDTWTSLATPVALNGGITIKKADLTVSKSHSPANPTTTTTTVSYTIIVANNGPSDASGIRVQDTIPTAVQTPTWTCAVVSPNLCALTSGSGNIDTTVDLKTGASATFTINGTLSGLAEGTVVTNPVTITRPNDVTNPAATADEKTETATDTFTVGLAGNNPPVATDLPATTPNDEPVKLPALSANDPDPGDFVQSYTITTLPPASEGVLYLGDPANGGTPVTAGQVLTSGQEGNLWFSPTPGFVGSSIFDYVATDNHGASTSPAAKVTVDVTAGNQPPVAQPATTALITNNETPVPLTLPSSTNSPLSANDPESGPVSYTITALPDPGQGVLYVDGQPVTTLPTGGQPVIDPSQLSFKPATGFSGNASFAYTATDNKGLASTPATVSIPVHLPPVASNNTISPPILNTSTGQLLPPSPLPATDDGTVVSYTIASLPDPSQGTLYLNSAATGNEVTPNQVLSPAEADKLYFKPNPAFTGDAKFTFTATDDKNAVSNVATVTIPVIAPPVATSDTDATLKGQAITINLLADDTNPNATAGSLPSITQTPPNGTATVNADGTVTYTPNSTFTGTDTFTYQICDKYGNCDTATVKVTVSDVTLPPVANDDTANAVLNTPVEVPIFTNDQNPNPDSLTITDPPDHGTVTISNPVDGTVTYTPTPGFTGTDTFTYETCDTSGKCDPATVTVNVSNPASPPQVTNDEDTTSPGQPVTISVLSNDPNATGDLSIKAQGGHGKAVVNSSDGTITYTPNPGFTGIDTFTYELCNDAGVCTTAEVKVTVAGTTPPPTDPPTPPPTDPTTPPPTNPPVTLPPTAPNPVTVDNDSATTTMGQPITIPVLANDHNADPSNVFVATPPAHGRVNVNADGTITYIPAPDFSGVDTFTYQACDAQNNCATATVTVNVSDLTSPPITKDDPAATTSGDPVIIPILANDENPNPDNVTIIDPPDHGTVVVNPDLTATYTPEPGFTGTDSFTYQTCNLKDQCDTATATINVTAPSSPTKPTLSVTFGGNGSGSVQSTPAGINCDTNTAGCTQIYDLATSVTLTPTPTADSEFVGWGGDGDCNDSNLSMTDDRHCIAYFNLASQPKFPLTVETTGEGSVTSQPVGVDCGADCGNDFPSNVLVNLTAIPEPGFIFTGWSGDCNGTASTVSVTMTQARTCVAHFEELPTLSNDVHHLTVTKIGTGNGTVISVLPGIDCGATCNNAYPHNSQITLTATPDPGTQFVGWSGSCSGTEPTITVMLDQAKSCIAIFDSVTPVLPPDSGYEEVLTVQNQSPFKATIRSDVAGIEILPSSSQGAKSAAHYPLGTVVKLTVTPEPGVKFVGFDGDEDCQDGTVTITQHLNCFPIFEQLHPGIVQFSSPTSTVDEFGNATTTITVSRKGGCDGKISVDYATFSDTATQPADYSSASGTLTWEDGDCADKIISIPIRNDSVGEDDETIDILLSHPTGGATLGPSKKATLTILDDESRSTTNTSTTTTNPSGCYNFSPCQMCCNSCQAEGEGGDESEIQFKTLILTLYVGQTMTITVADAAGDLLLKELPDQSIASLDNWTPIGKGAGTLTFTGMQVGTTNMLLVDGATPSKMASIHINVIEDNGMTISSEEEKVPGPANSFGVQAILVTLTVGQTVSVTVAGGKGELSIGEIPQPTVASLDAWIPLGATGAGEVTLRGVGVGNTKAVLLDRSDPPQKTIINVKVIPGGDSSTSSQGEGTEGENADGGDANGGDANGGDANSGNANGGNANGGDADFSADESGPIPEGTNGPLVWQGKPIAGTDSVLDKDACNHNSWGIDAKGEPLESHACFIGKISTEKGRYRNHQMLSHFDAQTLKLSETILVDPEHVGEEADILMVGVRTILTDQAKFTRDDQTWSLWDGNLSTLLVAQHEDQLGEVVEVPIYAGDLSFAPGEYYVFVGYRLQDGTIVYNGADFIHFYIGNAASMDLNNDSRKTVTSYDVETTAYFEPFIHNGKKGSDTKKGNAILFDNDETAYVSTFVRIDSKHVGQPADILMVAVYEQGDDYVIYTRDAYWWHEWDRRLESLQPTQHYHQLPLTMEIPIYFGKLSEKPGKFTVYIGYRLRDGVIIFNGFDPLQLTVAEAQTVGPRGMRNTVTPPPSHLIHQRYQTVENPFAGQSSVGFTNTLLVTPDLVGQVRDIVMVVTGQDEITAWEDLDKSQVVWEVTLPQVLLRPVMELPAFEGKGMEEYRVYVGYR